MVGPIFNLLKGANFNITVVCEKGNEPFLPFVNHITYKRKGTTAILGAVFDKINHKSYDLFVAAVPSNNNEWKRIRCGINASHYIYFETEKENEMRGTVHTLEMNHKLGSRALNIMGAAPDDPAKPAYHLYRKEEYNKNSRRVVMAVGCRNFYWRNKAFPLTLWRRFADWLISRGFSPIMVGSETQELEARAISQNVFMGMPIPDLIHLMEGAFAFVGNDCGPAHLAAALQLPTLTLFGPTDPGVTGPYPPNSLFNRCLHGKPWCSPCRFSGEFVDCKDPICHQEISLEDLQKEWLGIERLSNAI